MIEYKDQLSRDLNLQLLGRPPDFESLTVLERGEAGIHPLLLRAYIIGESHIVWVQMGEHCLSEIFSCSRSITSSSVLLSHPIGELVEPKSILHESLDYFFTCKVEDVVEGVNYAEALLGSRDDWNVTLSFDFPGEHGERPKTVLAVACNKEGSIVAKSLHSYPNEGKAVLTETTITRSLS